MPLSFFKPLSGEDPIPDTSTPAERQVGVIPYAHVDEDVTFLLITSRGTGKWIFPKGTLPEGIDARDMALREAREEAGVTGFVATEPLGSYRDWKTRDGAKVAIDVMLFPMRVDEQFDDWAESAQRYRHWVTFPEFRTLVEHDDVLALTGQLYSTLCGAGP